LPEYFFHLLEIVSLFSIKKGKWTRYNHTNIICKCKQTMYNPTSFMYTCK